MVFSPILFTEVSGYCFKFKICWSGVNKENFELSLVPCSGSGSEVLERFNIPHTFEMLDKDGNIRSEQISLKRIKANAEKYFTIPPGQKCSQENYVYLKFLTMPKLKKYIVNDAILIRCRFKLPFIG